MENFCDTCGTVLINKEDSSDQDKIKKYCRKCIIYYNEVTIIESLINKHYDNTTRIVRAMLIDDITYRTIDGDCSNCDNKKIRVFLDKNKMINIHVCSECKQYW